MEVFRIVPVVAILDQFAHKIRVDPFVVMKRFFAQLVEVHKGEKNNQGKPANFIRAGNRFHDGEFSKKSVRVLDQLFQNLKRRFWRHVQSDQSQIVGAFANLFVGITIKSPENFFNERVLFG